MIADHLEGLEERRHDVCVVGAGPVGITMAMALAAAGRSVLLLESGGEAPTPEVTALSGAHLADPARHDAMEIAVGRRLGGTSNLWAGRCQPLDAIDFEPRPMIGDARWPFGPEALQPYWERACLSANCGQPVFRAPISGVAISDRTFDPDRLERFSNRPKFQIAHREELKGNPRIDLRLHATVVDARFSENGRVDAIGVAGPDGNRCTVPVRWLVLACGGLEATRLLLSWQREQPERFGGPDGPLGRTYMGHLIGEVADIVFSSAAAEAAYDFFLDGHGSYARRRMIPSDSLQRERALPNLCFWPVVPPSGDPRHGSAVLSMILLALSFEPLGRRVIAEAIRKRHVPEGLDRWPHVVNVLRGLPATAAFMPGFLYRRYLSPMRLPGFFVRNRARTYGLSYHAEHLPNPSSRVTLSRDSDRFGLPRLSIDLRFSAGDAEGTARAHDDLALWLARTGLGEVRFRQDRSETAAAIMANASHGTHQIGTTRMGTDRNRGVVDANLRCFDADNLFVAGSSCFPTSGQANPTLTSLALSLRLSDHIVSRG